VEKTLFNYGITVIGYYRQSSLRYGRDDVKAYFIAKYSIEVVISTGTKWSGENFI
jgi:hypothetical protein